ncbi:MAG: D-alanyl-D-alanine carboxypeptidase/D-alanyl-D-alanine-endopeptidase [Ignavibacteriaceae bacterium]|nr:D-alanyl-D-alanine carboxypeptidase/D-alanyl-D-alanine-endopeptidase [Ignavibacteriaceae bacterium]
MVNRRIALFIILIGIVSVSAQDRKDTAAEAPRRYSVSTLPEFWTQMEDIFNDPSFSNANWGVLIQSLETGEYFYKRNEDKLFLPASSLKLFTTSAALNLLGPEYRFTTNIYKHGTIDGSLLKGDIIVQGRGDPTISGRFYGGDMLTVYELWADSLQNLGIEEIDGNIIGDDSEFDDRGLGEGWSWDDESYWYSAQSSAISFNDNCVNISVAVSRDKKNAKILVDPYTKYVVITNQVLVVPKDSTTDIDVFRDRGTNIITVSGTIKENSDTVRTFCTVNNPTQFAMVTLKHVLEMRGIKINGSSMVVGDLPRPVDYKDASLLFVNLSPPLREIIKVVNKNSQNFYAEQILKTIGLEAQHYGTVENGIESELDVFKDMGMNTDGMMLVDGSGLSRLDFVTPRQFVSLLNYMYKSRYFVPFFNSLPIAGEDGTMGTRLKGTRADGKIRAKTGYLTAVRSLCGYAMTAEDEPIAFAIIANNFNVPVKLAENLQDLVCLRLANFKRK